MCCETGQRLAESRDSSRCISPPNGPLKKSGETSEEDKLMADADSSKGMFTNVDPAVRKIVLKQRENGREDGVRGVGIAISVLIPAR